jgi:hypothetical protein
LEPNELGEVKVIDGGDWEPVTCFDIIVGRLFVKVPMEMKGWRSLAGTFLGPFHLEY